MNKEEIKRMEDFINATLKSDKPNEYRLGYEDALRKCYYFVDNLQQENTKLKEEINKIFKKEIKVRNMLYSIENGTLTRERLSQIEEVLFEMESNNE